MKEKNAKIDKEQKPSLISSTVSNDDADKFIQMLLQKREIKNLCAHYLVGASQYSSFLSGKYDFRRAYSIFFTTGKYKMTGQASKKAFMRSNFASYTNIHSESINNSGEFAPLEIS